LYRLAVNGALAAQRFVANGELRRERHATREQRDQNFIGLRSTQLHLTLLS
jgi:hypothetical protein